MSGPRVISCSHRWDRPVGCGWWLVTDWTTDWTQLDTWPRLETGWTLASCLLVSLDDRHSLWVLLVHVVDGCQFKNKTHQFPHIFG